MVKRNPAFRFKSFVFCYGYLFNFYLNGQTTMTACGAGKETGDISKNTVSSGKTNVKDVTTITLYPKDAMLQSGVIGGYKGELFADYGIAVDVWAYSDEKTNAILAGGALPDVMVVSKDNLEIMIEGGMVLNLENYLEALPNLTGNETISAALNYTREYNSFKLEVL